MPHYCIKYRNNEDGSIPDFVYIHSDSVYGMYPSYDPIDIEVSNFRNYVVVGVSEIDYTGDAEIINTQQDLETYIAGVGDRQLYPPTPVPEPGLNIDPATEAAYIWGKLALLNNSIQE